MTKQKLFLSREPYQVAFYRYEKLIAQPTFDKRPMEINIEGLAERLDATLVEYYHFQEKYKVQHRDTHYNYASK